MTYRPTAAPANEELADLKLWMISELDVIAAEFQLQTNIQLVQLNVAPTKPRSGLVVYADGTNWNPGSGEGIYVFRGAAWHFLG